MQPRGGARPEGARGVMGCARGTPDETGFVVEQADREALAAALARLLASEEMRRRMGEAGRLRYEAEFTFAPYRDRLAAILDEAFASPLARRR